MIVNYTKEKPSEMDTNYRFTFYYCGWVFFYVLFRFFALVVHSFRLRIVGAKIVYNSVNHLENE